MLCAFARTNIQFDLAIDGNPVEPSCLWVFPLLDPEDEHLMECPDYWGFLRSSSRCATVSVGCFVVGRVSTQRVVQMEGLVWHP